MDWEGGHCALGFPRTGKGQAVRASVGSLSLLSTQEGCGTRRQPVAACAVYGRKVVLIPGRTKMSWLLGKGGKKKTTKKKKCRLMHRRSSYEIGSESL